MKSFMKTLGCAVIVVATTWMQGAAATPKLPWHAAYDCTTEWHDTFTGFKLFLQTHSYRAWPDPVQFAKITADDGSVFSGKFEFKIIENRTRLSGSTQYHITTKSELGTIALSLIDSGPLWGNGVINVDGTETIILVNCKKL